MAAEILRQRYHVELDERLQEIRALKDRLQAVRREALSALETAEIVAESAVMKRVMEEVAQVASIDATVILLGETEVGKELLARAIHRMSSRKVGRFELADGSTLFLDEVGELSLEVQAKLLRVMQSGEFERLENSKTRKVDVRLVAATNRDLRKAIGQRTFREDLFYRLNVFPISLPRLRERPEDSPSVTSPSTCFRLAVDLTRREPSPSQAPRSGLARTPPGPRAP